jgi:O-antigen/teichoic acid export membrane protein
MHARLLDSIPGGAHVGDAIARVLALFADGSDSSLVRRLAGAAFLIRVISAALTFVSQILLARWMGSFEFGIYIYGWTWILLIGAMVDLGLGSAAQRFIPEYTEHKSFAFLRGFLSGSRWLALLFGTIAGTAGALAVRALTPYIDPATVVPLYISCAALPLFGVWSAQSGIARSYNWVNLGLSPVYVQRPLLLLGLMGLAYVLGLPTDAITATAVGVFALVSVGIGQVIVLNRRLAGVVESGPKAYATRTWLTTSVPIFLVEASIICSIIPTSSCSSSSARPTTLRSTTPPQRPSRWCRSSTIRWRKRSRTSSSHTMSAATAPGLPPSSNSPCG